MPKMIAKTIIDDHVKKSYKYINPEDFDIEHFFEYIRDICEYFDSPTPVLLAKHYRDFIIFNTVTFKPDDFVEKVFFDKLVIETFKGI